MVALLNSPTRGHAPLRHFMRGFVVLIVLTSGFAATPQEHVDAALLTSGSHTVRWGGGNWFLLGANTPWVNYGNDFGENAWGAFGFHSDDKYDAQIADMASKGVHVIRWWLFADGRAGIKTDASGTPVGLDDYVFQDLDRAVAIASNRGIYLDLVFFDYKLFNKPSYAGGVQTGGYSSWVANPTQRTALLDKVIKPILSRYGNQRRIMMWEVMNEPEWSISDLPEASVDSSTVPVTRRQFWDFAARITGAVHARTHAYATLGSASLKWHRVWTNGYADQAHLPRLNLDIYQSHYYEWMDSQRWDSHPILGTTWFSPLKQSYDDLHLDRPMIVAELSLGSKATIDTLSNNGYAGVWPWSYQGGDGYQIPWSSFSSWEAAHAKMVRIDGGEAKRASTPVCSSVKIINSQHSANSYSASRAYDHEELTAWHTTGSKPPRYAWLLFDVGSRQSVRSIRWVFAKAGFADSMRVQVSSDKASWTTIATRHDAPGGSWQHVSRTMAVRYVRFAFSNPHHDPKLGFLSEVRVCK